MSACYCGRCRGCYWAREAGERYDTASEEAREEAEREADELAIAEELSCYVDDDGQPFAGSAA